MSIDTQVAEQFGHAVARADFVAAHTLLTEEARRRYSPEALRHAVTEMTAYAGESIEQVEVMGEFILEEWPDKLPGDLAWVYVALSGQSFAEAASVLLATTHEGTRIREVEWGRP